MPESSLRTQGPITTGCSVVKGICLHASNKGRGVWAPAFAGRRRGLLRARELRLGLVAAEEDQEAAEQRQHREHQQAGRGLPRGFLDPADQIGPAEAGEVADRVDQRDGAAFWATVSLQPASTIASSASDKPANNLE